MPSSNAMQSSVPNEREGRTTHRAFVRVVVTSVVLALLLSAVALWANLSYGSLEWAEDVAGETI
jgi:hypothetical protein